MTSLSKLLILAVFVFSSAISFAENSFNFFTITDIHLDASKNKSITNINPTNGKKGGDLDEKTFVDLLSEIKNKKIIDEYLPESIIVLGDSNAHGIKGDARIRNINHVFAELNYIFSDITIISVFGNNDSLQQNYGSFVNNSGQSLYSILKKNNSWKNGFVSTGALPSKNKNQAYLLSENVDQGYYSVRLKEGLRLIGLNTVLFSSSSYSPFKGQESKQDKVALPALQWLNAQLNESVENNENVILAMHIPPGDDWQKHFLTAFKESLAKVEKKRPQTVIGILAGHTHMDELCAWVNKESGKVIPMIITPGLSTSHGNAPGFKNFTVAIDSKTKQWVIEDIQTFYYTQKSVGSPVSLKKYYSFLQAYGSQKGSNVAECLKSNIKKSGSKYVFKDSKIVELLSKKYTAGNPNNIPSNTQAKNWLLVY